MPRGKKKAKCSSLNLQPPTPSSMSSEDDSFCTSPGGRHSVRKETEQRRRNMMNQYFDELVMMLSMITDRVTPKKMDKASTLEEAVLMLRQYHNLDKSPVLTKEPEYKPGFFNRGDMIGILLDSLCAFLLVVSDNGRILYSSDMITSLSGHMPTRLVGQNFYDCIDHEDEVAVRSLFHPDPNSSGVKIPNSTITAYPLKTLHCSLKLYSNDPTNMLLKQECVCLSYLRQWTGRLLEDDASPLNPNDAEECGDDETGSSYVLLLGKLANSDRPIDLSVTTNDVNFQFSMRVSKEGKILDIDKQASLILGYTSTDLQGSPFFDYIDPYHSERVGEAIEMFLNKGLGVSQPYRMSTKSGRYVWMVSRGYLSYNPWNHKPDHVLLENKILGCDEVLPEYRFKVDNSKLPNTVEDYSPDFNKTGNEEIPVEPQHTLSIPSSNQSIPQMLHVGGVSDHGEGRLYTHLDPISVNAPSSFGASTSSGSLMETTGLSSGKSVDDIVQQLERKNQEIFELQKKMFEQQQLFEQERRQFYQVSNQIMMHIGKQSNLGPCLDPNMAMAISTAGTQQPPPFVSQPPQSTNSFIQFSGQTTKQQFQQHTSEPLPYHSNPMPPFPNYSYPSSVSSMNALPPNFSDPYTSSVPYRNVTTPVSQSFNIQPHFSSSQHLNSMSASSNMTFNSVSMSHPFSSVVSCHQQHVNSMDSIMTANSIPTQGVQPMSSMSSTGLMVPNQPHFSCPNLSSNGVDEILKQMNNPIPFSQPGPQMF